MDEVSLEGMQRAVRRLGRGKDSALREKISLVSILPPSRSRGFRARSGDPSKSIWDGVRFTTKDERYLIFIMRYWGAGDRKIDVLTFIVCSLRQS